MHQISVGLVGYGFAAAVFHAPLITAEPGMALRRIACLNIEDAKRDYPGVQVDDHSEAMFNDPEIELVVIATPNSSHFPLARAALLAGKNVVVDKPFVVSVPEGEKLIRLAEERGRLISVFHNRRWDNDFLTVRRIIDSGQLGLLGSYEAHYDRFAPVVDQRWREQRAAGAGVLFDLGSHLIDQALQLFGLPQFVFAEIATQRPGAQVDDFFHLLLDYGTLKVNLRASMLVREPGPRYQVHGAHGSFIKYGLDSQEAALMRGERPGHPRWGSDEQSNHGVLAFDVNGLPILGRIESAAGSYETFYKNIATALVDHVQPPVSGLEALNVIRVIECAQRSNAEQRKLPFA